MMHLNYKPLVHFDIQMKTFEYQTFEYQNGLGLLMFAKNHKKQGCILTGEFSLRIVYKASALGAFGGRLHIL